jgi:hypothetical protein
MNQAAIDRIKRAQKEVHDIPRRYREELRMARLILSEVDRNCDHKYPDGTSAVKGDFFCSVCQICYENDM